MFLLLVLVIVAEACDVIIDMAGNVTLCDAIGELLSVDKDQAVLCLEDVGHYTLQNSAADRFVSWFIAPAYDNTTSPCALFTTASPKFKELVIDGRNSLIELRFVLDAAASEGWFWHGSPSNDLVLPFDVDISLRNVSFDFPIEHGLDSFAISSVRSLMFEHCSFVDEAQEVESYISSIAAANGDIRLSNFNATGSSLWLGLLSNNTINLNKVVVANAYRFQTFQKTQSLSIDDSLFINVSSSSSHRDGRYFLMANSIINVTSSEFKEIKGGPFWVSESLFLRRVSFDSVGAEPPSYAGKRGAIIDSNLTFCGLDYYGYKECLPPLQSSLDYNGVMSSYKVESVVYVEYKCGGGSNAASPFKGLFACTACNIQNQQSVDGGECVPFDHGKGRATTLFIVIIVILVFCTFGGGVGFFVYRRRRRQSPSADGYVQLT